MTSLRDFRIGWRLLINEPIYSTVAVAGLALAFAACFLLLGYVDYSYSYDSRVPDNAHLYFVKSRMNLFSPPLWDTRAAPPMAAIARASGLASATSKVIDVDAVVVAQARSQRVKLSAVDPEFLNMFGLRTLQGDLPGTLSRPDAIALTSATAQKLFAAADVLGRRVNINGTTLLVMAVLPNLPSNSGETYDALVGMGSVVTPAAEKDRTNWHSGRSGRLYLRLRPGVSPAAMEGVLQEAVDRLAYGASMREGLATRGLKHAEDIRLTSVADSYFDPDLFLRGDRGNKNVVNGLALVAVLIVLLAAGNYVNLALVRTLRRQREIGLRKLLGAGIRQVVAQFVAESVLVTLLAAVMGLLVAWIALPIFCDLMLRKLDTLFTMPHLLVALFAALVVGVLAGVYPAWIALRVRPAATLTGRGNVEALGGIWVRRVLTMLQFAVAMGFTGFTLAIVWQAHFASTLEPGFDPANLLVVTMPVDMQDSTGLAFHDQLMHVPGVLGVAASGSAPGGDDYVVSTWTKNRSGVTVLIRMQNISANYFDIYQVKPLFGRLYHAATDRVGEQHVAVINEKAALALGFSSALAAVGQPYPNDSEHSIIIGIAPELRHQSVREISQPMVYGLSPRTPVLTVRFNGKQKIVEREIERLWAQTFPNDVIVMRSARTALGENYAEDRRLAQLFAWSSALAIAIAAFGIYVLSAYSVQRRSKEIVLRKLYGADSGAIARLLSGEFVSLLIIGALIGLPLAQLANAHYLADFVERAPMAEWPLIGALTLTAWVALLAVARHVIRALRMVPLRVFRSF